MYQQSNTLIPENTITNQQYLELLNRIVNITKTIENNRLRRSIVESMSYHLPNGFSSHYLELAFSIKLAEDKIIALSNIFYKLSDQDKVLAREEIKSKFFKIRNEAKKANLLSIIICYTKDKELALYFKDQVNSLSSKHLLIKSKLLLNIALFLDEIGAKRLQNQVLSEVLAITDSCSVYWYLDELLDKGLSEEIKEKAIGFIQTKWLKQECSFQGKLSRAKILRYLPSDSAQRMYFYNELYKELNQLHKNKLNKTKLVGGLLTLANKPGDAQFLLFYNQALCVIRQMKDNEKIDASVLYKLTSLAPEELAMEVADLLLAKFYSVSTAKLITGLLIDLLRGVSKENSTEILKLLSIPMLGIDMTDLPDITVYFWELQILEFLPVTSKKYSADSLFDFFITYEDEKTQATSVGRFIQYLSSGQKELVLTVIENMESATHKATALAGVLDAFEGTEFISLAEKLLVFIEISIDEGQTASLIYSLVGSIGRKLTESQTNNN